MRALAFLFAVLAVCVAAPPPAAPPGPAAPTPEPEPIFPEGLVPKPVIVDLDDSWFGFPFFRNFFSPIFNFSWFPNFADIGPKIISDDDKFQVTISVKGYDKSDLKVKVKNGNIVVQGISESKPADHNIFASQFFHTYSLPVNASGADVTAELSSDSYLTVSASIKGSSEKRDEAERIVDIVETGSPYNPPKSTEASADDAPAVPEGTTTAPIRDREEVTEKDNIIPHGNDVVPI